METLKGMVAVLMLCSVGYGFLYKFFGVTTITANVDGVAVTGAEVFVDGIKVGVTPWSARLGPGIFDILILPPPSVHFGKQEKLLRFESDVLGVDYSASFKSDDVVRAHTTQLPIWVQ
ncbi:MAG: hypothetical protein WCJ29_01945 [bacterium]